MGFLERLAHFEDARPTLSEAKSLVLQDGYSSLSLMTMEKEVLASRVRGKRERTSKNCK